MNEVVDEIYENETAEELYERIQSEKERLISEGKLKKQKKLPEISEDEIPFEIPKSWKWVRLGEIGDYKKGPFGSALKKSLFIPKGDNTIKVYEQKNAIKKDITLGEYYISYDYFKSHMSSFEVQQNDILVSCAGTIGETYIIPNNFEKGIINQALMRIRLASYIDKNYFLIVFDILLRQLTIKDSKGSAIKNIPPFENLKSYLFPLPPLSEQKKISELIDRLFEKLDEAKEKALSALNTFELRKAKILHLAIQGKLSKQLDEYKTAEELYEKIQIEKEKLISEGKLKKQKKLPEISEDEIPFEIPKSWKWVRLGEIGNWGAGSTPLRSNPNYYNGNIPWLKTGELNDDYINYAEEFITEEAINKTSLRLNPIGSVLIAMYGATIGKLGILNIESTTNQACCACITYNGIYNRYLFYYLKAMRNNFIRMGSGGAQPNISRENS